MLEQHVIKALGALAQAHRLRVFRLLVPVAPNGIAAGEIAARLGIPPSSLSFHLAQLEAAGLVRSWRRQRHVLYAAEPAGVRLLLRYLLAECCGGRPELCSGLLDVDEADDVVERETSMNETVHNVLFLCTGNSARSIIAECILNRVGRGRFNAFSAGSVPKGEVHADAIALLRSQNFTTEGLRSKSWDEFARADAPPIDVVITVCEQAAQETCPVWPGGPVCAHWGVPDPAAVDGSDADRQSAFADAYRRLHRRIESFVKLPVDRLDGPHLERELDAIGTIADGAELERGAGSRP